MTRHYSPYDTAATERFGDHSYEPSGYSGHTPDYQTDYSTGRYGADAEADYGYDADYDDEVTFYEEPIDRRWIWVAAVAGAILLIAVICTVVILGGGDSGSVSATVTSAQPTQTAAPTQDATSKPVPPRAAPTAPLSPETVTTVTPTPSATATPAPVPPPAAAPPAAVATPNAITYRVTGNRQLIDLVTIVYTDAQGALQTDINVALPWAKTVVLNPGVTLKSVTATSVAGQLNCSITDASGNVLVAQANNTMITTCTQ
ncbi:hypothetical protein BA059_14980 [Mycolicibacterium sp. (ex Dasyatis americana)]|uniref:hypothetical protein n=1 Tax=Mycobacterium TaxID=1763 RepID=UPI00087325A2|nr:MULTISPECIES: hypothetical protein [Mycobacterium]MCG7609412.1 hypothetical protein [Mycobacterium sp. CnD-18-1]OFB38129.1 hypothetical protein BA059_14980 [Mycolicibacterium sp. (ex Dasyatis americana)]OLT87217.1 hypothetical protein BKG60_28955 [Mycobacterium syngnathidarum]TMS53337.1 hypothetical protein E0T84_12110 [Mycobacterium sp. DBP42]